MVKNENVWLFTFTMVLFTANSDDRDNKVGDTTASFSITCDRFRGVKEPNKDGAQITVQSLALPNTLYNVMPFNNTIVYWTTVASFRTVSLTPGRYTVAQFAAHVSEVVTADMVASLGAGNSLDVTYSEITMKLTFTPTLSVGGAEFQLRPDQAAWNAYYPLGFRSWDPEPVRQLSGVELTAPYVVNLGYDTIYLWCDVPGVMSYSTHRKNWGNLLAVLHPTNECAGALMIWRAEWHNGFRVPDMWTKVRFELRDHEDRFLELNGSDVNVTLNITGLKDGLPKAGYFRPSQEMRDFFLVPPPWYDKPFLPSVYNNPKRPAGNNGLVLDPGFMVGGELDRQIANPVKHPHGFSRSAKRLRR